ncbi:MAG TPA: tRNA pseudouridine(55) synthase TruB [Candidatus Marinimicrobia bacterium]|jgi:tRNA pseudouridine55 synthase|nr:tRNA pseudouridine(55) synthase TruB [Candidatus Neomarinimicrobiota bacterium]MDP7512881.1 tRNA pseudouridine(55) synthase TruB [Candidatus Neomarinimicrobiota bacterium]HBR86257.1 tRNA pseudouridine(55) synthase TruB [Candidatus Neomarinimicrobiota bacterium]HJL62783.1 tRNA pseudouridine(55) synthase TruB [Candidatus Neomarinimicrobiota bacterium]HJM12390.1 tRNA pseudouridine(55) synthase TruB [Candidatus Neomarinimicrobiota bacterium]|tara:strand:+ start:1421 stop:2065 length:645 start_codon:yes stop_codon:yes gene_type:complete
MILNMYKPKGWTSFDVVKKVRSITKEKKVGHGGTLDPFAEGVLVLGTGSDTKKLGMISDSNKEYVATLKLGSRTDTHDIEGHVVEDKAIPTLTLEEVETVLRSFIGEQYQTPPMYSAKKVNGQRLYKLARKNIEIEREPCLIKIVDIELIHFNSPVIEFSVTCSKGTYIRVLGSDIANQLGTVGHLIALKRKKVGEYAIDETIQMDDLVSNGCI